MVSLPCPQAVTSKEEPNFWCLSSVKTPSLAEPTSKQHVTRVGVTQGSKFIDHSKMLASLHFFCRELFKKSHRLFVSTDVKAIVTEIYNDLNAYTGEVQKMESLFLC